MYVSFKSRHGLVVASKTKGYRDLHLVKVNCQEDSSFTLAKFRHAPRQRPPAGARAYQNAKNPAVHSVSSRVTKYREDPFLRKMRLVNQSMRLNRCALLTI